MFSFWFLFYFLFLWLFAFGYCRCLSNQVKFINWIYFYCQLEVWRNLSINHIFLWMRKQLKLSIFAPNNRQNDMIKSLEANIIHIDSFRLRMKWNFSYKYQCFWLEQNVLIKHIRRFLQTEISFKRYIVLKYSIRLEF